MKTVASRVAARARVQHGLVTYDQAIECGLAEDALRRWRSLGRVERVQPRVYRVAGAPETPEQRLLAAVLTTGGVASHRAAARLWGLGEDGGNSEVEVTVAGSGRRLHGGVIHRSQDLAAHHVTKRAGIPVTTPMRTLVDLGAVGERGRRDGAVADALERALIARVCSVVAIERTLDDVARRGRSGAGVIRRVLDERALGQARPDGLLEARMARLLREHGLPAPRFQYRVRGPAGRLLARVDFAYPAERVALEVDGFEVHSSPKALQADLERQNRLVAAGWTVLRFTWLDVVRRPEFVVAQVGAVLRGRMSA
jgi:very-short-patch-repair endonuclease/predicted transcriptional regulator of viral defense system